MTKTFKMQRWKCETADRRETRLFHDCHRPCVPPESCV